MENRKEKHSQLRSTFAQGLASLAVYANSVNVAMIIGMPVIVIGALAGEGDSIMKFTDEEASWFGGMVFIIHPVGALLAGFCQDVLGRKTCLMIVNLPEVIGWLMLYFASSVYTLFAAEVFLGLSIGFAQASIFSYAGELSEARLRGILSTINTIMFSVGFITINSLGALSHWRTVCLLCAGVPVLTPLFVVLIPESPAWLVSKGRVEDARKSYQWLRGWVSYEEVRGELDTLLTYVERTQALTKTKESKLQVLLHPSVLRPLFLITTHFMVGSCAMLVAVKTFIIPVLTAMNVPLKPHVALVMFNVETLLGCLVSTFLMRRLGKRGLTFLSLGLCVPCCLSLGLYVALHLKITWVPLVLFFILHFSGEVGLGGIPFVLVSELFPLRQKGLAVGVASAVGFICYFLTIKTYFNVVHLVGNSGAYFLYAALAVLGSCYLYKYLPETEGVPLEDIERFFDGKRDKVKGERNKTTDKTGEDIPLQIRTV